jgi:hypothetical protein
MKYLFTIFTISFACIALAGFAQTDAASEIYGEFEADYDYTLDMTAGDPPLYGGFNIETALIGFKTSISEKLFAHIQIEADHPDYELHYAYLEWQAADLFLFSVGRMDKVFAPNSEEHKDTVFDGIGGSLHLDMVTVQLQMGADENMGIPVDDGGDLGLIIMPALVVAPGLGHISLEAGINARFKMPYWDASENDYTEDAEMSANVYVIFGIHVFELIANMDVNQFQNQETSQSDLFFEASYQVETVRPGVMVMLYDVLQKKDYCTVNIELYMEWEAEQGFTITPILAFQNISANDTTWEITLRFSWEPSIRF